MILSEPIIALAAEKSVLPGTSGIMEGSRKTVFGAFNQRAEISLTSEAQIAEISAQIKISCVNSEEMYMTAWIKAPKKAHKGKNLSFVSNSIEKPKEAKNISMLCNMRFSTEKFPIYISKEQTLRL